MWSIIKEKLNNIGSIGCIVVYIGLFVMSGYLLVRLFIWGFEGILSRQYLPITVLVIVAWITIYLLYLLGKRKAKKP